MVSHKIIDHRSSSIVGVVFSLRSGNKRVHVLGIDDVRNRCVVAADGISAIVVPAPQFSIVDLTILPILKRMMSIEWKDIQK
jgi:hypothetical protein